MTSLSYVKILGGFHEGQCMFLRMSFKDCCSPVPTCAAQFTCDYNAHSTPSLKHCILAPLLDRANNRQVSLLADSLGSVSARPCPAMGLWNYYLISLYLSVFIYKKSAMIFS